MGWLTGYKNRRLITVSQTAGAGTNYPVKVTALYPVPDFSTDSYGTLFCSSFETPWYGDWDSVPTMVGAVAATVTDWSSRGRRAFKITGLGAFGDRAYLTKTIAQQADLWIACDIMLPAIPAFGAGEYINALGPDLFNELGVLYDVNAQKWGIQWHDDHAAWTNTWQTGTSALLPNTKYTVQFHIVVDAVVGEFSLYINDALTVALTGLNTSTTVTTTLFIGGWNNFNIGTNFAIYFDNYVAALSKMPYNQNAAYNGGEYIYCNAKCQADFDDIRFTSSDGVTELDFFLAEKTDSDYATFYVKVPDNLTAGSAQIYMYYGNTTAVSGSNGANTFALFDHFDDAAVGAEWTSSGTGTTVESGTVLTVTGGGGANIRTVYGATAFGNGYRLIAKYKRTTFTTALGFGDSALANYALCNGAEGAVYYKLQNLAAAPETLVNSSLLTDALDHLIEVRRLAAAVSLLIDGFYTATDAVDVPAGNLPVLCYSYSTGVTIIDWLGVAKYVSPEPTLSSAMSEQSRIAGILVALGMI